MTETLGSAIVSTKQQQIAELAGRMPEGALSSLAHHMDLDWLGLSPKNGRHEVLI